MKALELMGLSYQDLTAVALNDGAVTPEIQVKKVEEKLEAMIKAQEAAELSKAEDTKKAAAQREEHVINDFKKKIISFLDSDPKSYEAIKFRQAEDWVYSTIEEHYQRTIDPETGVGIVMTEKEAADKVEAALRKEYQEASRLSFLVPTQKPTERQKLVETTQFKPRPQRTLTNQLSAMPQAPRTRPLSDDERVRKAIAYAQGLRA